MIKLTFTLKILVLSTLLLACDSDSEADVSGIEIDLKINHLEDILVDLDDTGKVETFLKTNDDLVVNFFVAKNPIMREPGALPSALLAFGRDLHVDTLHAEVKTNFQDFSALENGLRRLFQHLKYYYPDYKLPKVYTLISAFGAFGFGNDIYVSVDLLVLGLDYFSSDMTTYKPAGLPHYLLERYNKTHLLPSVALAISTLMNAHDRRDQSLLGEMIFYGKSYAFVNQIIPNLSDAFVIGYSDSDLELCRKNEKIIWTHFIDHKLLFDQSRAAKQKYVYERPKTSEIADNCPGRVGRWLGWQIVKDYLDNNNLTLSEVMKYQDARQILEQSKYKPD